MYIYTCIGTVRRLIDWLMCYFKYLDETDSIINENNDNSVIISVLVIVIPTVAVVIMTLIFIVFIINIMRKRYHQLYGKWKLATVIYIEQFVCSIYFRSWKSKVKGQATSINSCNWWLLIENYYIDKVSIIMYVCSCVYRCKNLFQQQLCIGGCPNCSCFSIATCEHQLYYILLTV